MSLGMLLIVSVAFLVATVLRQNYLSPRTTTDMQLPISDLSITQWWTKGGTRVSDGQINGVLSAINPSVDPLPLFELLSTVNQPERNRKKPYQISVPIYAGNA